MRRTPFSTAQHVPNPVAGGVLPAKRAGMVKGKNTYKLATKNAVDRSNQILLTPHLQLAALLALRHHAHPKNAGGSEL